MNCSQSTGAFLVAINDLSLQLADFLKEIEVQKVMSVGYGWFRFFSSFVQGLLTIIVGHNDQRQQ